MKDSHYRLLNLVGEGQFGKVYTAIHRQTGELVALKELNPQRFSTKKFLREMRILLSLEHPNIVACRGVEHNSQGRYLVTEYCEGGTLRDLLNSSIELTREQKLKIFRDILEGLNHAHIEGIIHRDLKPENILLCINSHGWTAKLSDFGVAKIELEDRNINVSTMGDTGSPAYMAPEQFYGKYSYSSDLYAMGIILYELLIGSRPFSGSPYEIMIKHLNQTPAIPEEIPSSLRDIILQALQKLPQHRFRTAQEMKTALLSSILELPSDNEYLYKKIPYQSVSLELKYRDSFSQRVNHVVAKNDCICFGGEQNLWSEYYQENNGQINFSEGVAHQFNSQIVKIKLVTDGWVIATKNLSNYRQYSLFHCGEKIKTLIGFETEFLTFALPDNYGWIALNKILDNEQGFQIINPKNLKAIMPLIKDFIPKQIINIDRLHGVVIYNQLEIDKNQTFFRFFNRRGCWYDTYTVSLRLHNVVYGNDKSKTFITRERQTNNIILIKFNPFYIQRIPLNFRADYWLFHGDMCICSNQEGNIAFLDIKGNYLGQTNIKMNISSIVPLKTNKLLIITDNEKGQEKRIYQIPELKKINENNNMDSDDKS